MLKMYEAWEKGINPYSFRMNLTSDLMFIKEMDEMKTERKKELEHEQKIKQALQNLKKGF